MANSRWNMRTQVRGAGESARSLNTSGEEIYVPELFNTIATEATGWMGGLNLIRRITDANIKIWQLCFTHISEQNLQPLLLRLPLHTLRQLGRHSRIHLDCNHLPRLLQDLDCKIPRSRANLQHDVRLLQPGFVDDSLRHPGVLENVLAKISVHLEDIVDSLRGGFFGGVGGLRIGRFTGTVSVAARV